MAGLDSEGRRGVSPEKSVLGRQGGGCLRMLFPRVEVAEASWQEGREETMAEIGWRWHKELCEPSSGARTFSRGFYGAVKVLRVD